MVLVDPDIVRVPSAVAWASIRKSAQGAGEAEVAELDRALAHWPDRLRRIVGTQEMADDWWHQGEEPEAQPWLGLVRTLEVGVTEILAVPKSSSWDRYGFPSIRRIELSSADSRRASIALGRLPKLAEMDLGQVSAEGRQPIKIVAAAAPMRVLQLRRCGIDKRGLMLIRDRHHERLEELDLQFNEIGSAGVKILAQWPVDAPLRKLRVSSCFLHLSDFSEWLDAPLLQTLTHLDIGDSYGRESDLTNFRWLALPALQALRLSGLRLGDALPAALVDHAELPTLRRLEIANIGCGLDGLVALIEAGWHHRLEVLDLSDNHLDDRSIDRLVAQPRGRLREVLVEGNALMPASLARLREWLESRVSGSTTS